MLIMLRDNVWLYYRTMCSYITGQCAVILQDNERLYYRTTFGREEG